MTRRRVAAAPFPGIFYGSADYSGRTPDRGAGCRAATRCSTNGRAKTSAQCASTENILLCPGHPGTTSQNEHQR